MPADRLLITLLRSLQVHPPQQEVPRLLSTGASVLATLSNPLNITLLTAQLLTAPAIWTSPNGLQTCVQVMGVFHSAALAILKYEEEVAEAEHHGRSPPAPAPGQSVVGGGLSREVWVTAVLRGADQRSELWKHLLAIAGLLNGFQGQSRRGLKRGIRGTVESAFVQALNLSLVEARAGDEIGAQVSAMALNMVFELLSREAKASIDYDHLLPVLMGSAFFSSEGYRSGHFLASIDPDLRQVQGNMWTWSPESPSFRQLNDMFSKPLVASMGSLASLISHTIANLSDSWLVQSALDDLVEFSKVVSTQWRSCRLSEIDAAEEAMYVDQAAMTTTIPVLWRQLRSMLFASVIVLQGMASRSLRDPRLAADRNAPHIATQMLHTLRNLSFISTRQGSKSSTRLTFVYLTAMDILSAYPRQSEAFLTEIRPVTLGQISPHPLDRTHDLFFLNTAEHFTLILSPKVNEDLLLAATAPYLVAGSSNHLLEIFEAAHSVTLSVLSSPHNAPLAARHLPFYISALFAVFPSNLSCQQFRFAFRTLVALAYPPSNVAAQQPDLAATLMELVHHRAVHATDALLPLSPAATFTSNPEAGAEDPAHRLDERTAVTLTLIDCLPFLPPALLEEWLPLAAAIIPSISRQSMRGRCRTRFWDVVSAGDMDVQRSMICVGWWGTRGGREMVLGSGDEGNSHLMSGALNAPLPGDANSKI